MTHEIHEFYLKVEDGKFIRCQHVQKTLEGGKIINDRCSGISAEEFVQFCSKITVPDVPVKFISPCYREL